jgi:ribosomal protein S18 acetylase RimI-like enzyme
MIGPSVRPPLQLRVLGTDDLTFADSLRAKAGWNQTREDWQRFLAMEPEGCFLAQWDGAAAGTAVTLRYASELAWIGMVLVEPEYRGRGIGRALLEHCVVWLQRRGVRCIKLDATPLGKRLYDGLGFRDEWTLARWEHAGLQATKPDEGRHRLWQVSDGERCAAPDVAAFGVARDRLVEALARQSRLGLVSKTAQGHIAAYGFIRNGARAAYLGPIVAESDEIGLPLVQALLASSLGEPVFWDIPDANTAAVDWARRQGFTRQRALMRMYLGENTAPGDPQRQFALAGPEVG